MIKLDQASVKKLRRRILIWYRNDGRSFPWRTTKNPYRTLVSEIMLQQTQTARVAEKLPLFLKRFPTFEALAHASRAEVIRFWRGMGYNNRAVRLQRLATIVVEQFHGELPAGQLRSLPGIGPYTAHAVACFAFRKRVPVVDVNIQRVLSRVFWNMRYVSALRDKQEIFRLAERILPRDAYSWNQALMDVGSTLCKARRPLCPLCPAANMCRSRHLGSPQKHRRNHNLKRRETAQHSEPLYDGVPRRLWRGRVVEVLRNVNGRGSISLWELGRTVKPDFKKQELPWLANLVDALARDGLVSKRRDRQPVEVMLASE